MKGIVTDVETGDLIVERGTLVIGETDSQIAEHILLTMRGEWKEWPLIGGEARKLMGGEMDVIWRGELKKMLKACGLKVKKITLSADDVITIE